MLKYIIPLLIFVLPFSATAQNKVYKVAVEAYYPPFAFLDETGKLTGFDVDIAKALCDNIKIKCEVVAIPFDDAVEQIANKKIDIAVMGMGKTSEREKYLIFSDKYYRSNSIFVGVPGKIEATAKGLDGKTVALQTESLQYKYLKENFPSNIKVIAFTDFEDVAKALKDRKADIALVDGLAGYSKLKTDDWRDFDVIGEPINLGDSFIAVGKSETKLRDQINSAIKDIRKSGEYDKINRKYFDFIVY